MIKDWLPNYDSAILISEFNTVETLAAYIKELDGNDDRYDHYLRHKIEGIISNKFLKNVLRSRRWDGYDSLIEEFECQLCLRLHQFDEEGSETYEKFRVDETHYYCPFPTNPSLPVEKTASDESTDNSWFSILRNARCEGRAVFEFVSEGVSYSRQELDQRSHQLMQDNACWIFVLWFSRRYESMNYYKNYYINKHIRIERRDFITLSPIVRRFFSSVNCSSTFCILYLKKF